jgi:hypothetical protein
VTEVWTEKISIARNDCKDGGGQAKVVGERRKGEERARRRVEEEKR